MTRFGRWRTSRLFACSAVAAVASCALLVATTTQAENRNEREYRLKAAFVYNFTKFVSWPEQPERDGDGTVLCVLGDDFVHRIVHDTVNGKAAQGKAIRVERFGKPFDVQRCHLLFVSQTERRHLGKLRRAAGEGVLLVSEAGSFGEDIAMVNLVVHANRVRFEIDVEAAERAGLRISSKLLKLAKIVD